MGIFASIAVLLMGIKLAGTSVHAIADPQEQIVSPAVVLVLVLSILVKVYMYYYNKSFAKLTDSETLKAAAADCISDSIATASVLISTVISHITHFDIDGYCGVLVSVFIMFAGVKSLWEALAQTMTEQISAVLKKYSDEIKVDHFRLIENGSCINLAFDMDYPANLQKREEEIRKDLTERMAFQNPNCRMVIKGIIRRKPFRLRRNSVQTKAANLRWLPKRQP